RCSTTARRSASARPRRSAPTGPCSPPTSGRGPSMLAIDELRVTYGRVPALHGVSLHVDEGEVVALVGPNGAGKTTTLSAVFGLVEIEHGAIEFEGESLIGARPEQILRKGLALVPEGRHIFGSLTVAENLELGTTAR